MVEKLIDRAAGASFTQQKEVKLKSVKYDPTTFKKISEEERVEVVPLQMTAPPISVAGLVLNVLDTCNELAVAEI